MFSEKIQSSTPAELQQTAKNVFVQKHFRYKNVISVKGPNHRLVFCGLGYTSQVTIQGIEDLLIYCSHQTIITNRKYLEL